MVNMGEGDLLVFYGGMRPIHPCRHKLIYALMGLYVVQEVVHIADVPRKRDCTRSARRIVRPLRTVEFGFTGAKRA